MYPRATNRRLLEPHWPGNDDGRFDAPLTLLGATIDAGYRLVEKTKEKKSQIAGTELIARLNRNPEERA